MALPSDFKVRYSAGRFLQGLLPLIACGMLNGCDFGDSIDDAVRILQDTASRIEGETNDIEEELSRAIDLAEELPKDLRETVKVELRSTINRAIAVAGAEGRCDIRYVHDLVKDDLQRLIARLRKQSVEPPTPFICNPDPLTVDISLEPNRRREIVYFGYNMPTDPRDGTIKAILVGEDQDLDVSQHLKIASNYQMVLDLGPNATPVSSKSESIVLSWKGRRISVVDVSQSTCETEEDSFSPENQTYAPILVEGDKEFGGNGPSVKVVFTLTPHLDRVDGILSMTARETDDDGRPTRDKTTVRGNLPLRKLYEPKPGWHVVRLLGNRTAEWSFRDNDLEPNVYNMAVGPVRQFTVHGDTEGNDAEEGTSVIVDFNRIGVIIRESGDCVRQKGERDARDHRMND